MNSTEINWYRKFIQNIIHIGAYPLEEEAKNKVKLLRRKSCSKGRRRVSRPRKQSKHFTLTLTVG